MYSLQQYESDCLNKSLSEIWDFILDNNIPLINPDFQLDHLGELYEKGLALSNKIAKKEQGKYYTPIDVANVMAEYFIALEGNAICDVCCGVGNLILAVLNQIDNPSDFIKQHHVYLYDIDPIALNICKYTISAKYGAELLPYIHIYCGNILNRNITFPVGCKIISNPPYGKISTIEEEWDDDVVISETKDYYSAIFNKILNNSLASCNITPHSFLYGDKFLSFRKNMNNYSGDIFAFDNVPGNIFNGIKYGIFNTNNVNSVRAAITVTYPHQDKGYRISNFIRFPSESRKDVLTTEFLNNSLSIERQLINDDNSKFCMMLHGTEELCKIWLSSDKTIEDLIINQSNYRIIIPDTCRYFTVASVKNLHRTGKHIIYANNIDSFAIIYGLFNSTLGYYFYRMYNGGIVYPIGLLKSMPVPEISKDDMIKLKTIVKEMISIESNHITIKRNAGADQENIKFPETYREQLNEIFCKGMIDKKLLSFIHDNRLEV